jgi:hypothetical protein
MRMGWVSSMKRIARRKNSWRRSPIAGQSGELFRSESSLRPMVLLVDAELVDPPATGPDQRSRSQKLLADLLGVETFVVYRYADAGPPAGTATVSLGDSRLVFPGWAVISEKFEGVWGVVSSTGEGWTLSGVAGNTVDIAERDTGTLVYADLDLAEAASRRGADALAAQVASQALEVDVFISERPYLHEAKWRVADDTTVCNVDDALALIGLYLRTKGLFHIAKNYTFNQGLFTWVATRELLPSAWRWFSAIVHSGAASGDERLSILAGSLLQRFQRALVGRDALLIALNRSQNNDVRDDALTALDDVSYRLMGAFDVLARVAHRICGLSSKEQNVGWQKTGWLAELATVAPDLADLLRPGEQSAGVLTVLRLLRNTIHGEALQGLHVQTSGRQDRSLVALNSDDATQILAAMDLVGGRARWGVEELLPGRVHIEPGVLVEELFAQVAPILNELMDRTPVESLPGVSLKPADLVPPEGYAEPFSEPCRFSIRKQYGF